MSASGKAMAMRIELSRYRREPPPFAPPALLNAPDHDVIVEGYAAPDLVDREFMRFASYCWYPLPKEIPLLVKHESNRPAGKILEARLDDGGLYVKALVTDSEAKRYSHFSVAATIRDYRIRDADNPQAAHALIINASLDEISLTNTPANPAAKILFRDRPPPALQTLDLAKAGVSKMMEIVALLQKINNAPRPAPPHQATPKAKPRSPVVPHRATPFKQLVDAIERNSQ